MPKYGQAALTANQNNLVATLPAGNGYGITTSINIAVGADATNISVYVVPTGTSSPSQMHALQIATPAQANEPIEFNGLALDAGDQIFVNPGASSLCACTVTGDAV